MIKDLRILINASNIKSGGGIQVALDVLIQFTQKFKGKIILVTSTELHNQILQSSKEIKTIVTIKQEDKSSIISKWRGKNKILDQIVNEYNIRLVFSIFGPIYWRPRVVHLVGYAKPHHVYTDSPFFKTRTFKEKLLLKLKKVFELRAFKYNSDIIWSETPNVTERLKNLFPEKKIFTAGNFINIELQNLSYSDKERVHKNENELLILYPSAYYPHKNFEILIEISENLDQFGIKHKFICTTRELYSHEKILFIGSLSIQNLAQLYQECDIVISTSLLECFSANYIEAMYFNKPLVVPDLPFAKTIVKESGIYFEPLSALSAARQIKKLIQNPNLKDNIIKNNKKEVVQYLDSSERFNKINEIIEQMI